MRGRVHIAAICVGMAERLLAESVAHARIQQAGRPADRRVPAGAGDAGGHPDRRLRGPGDGRWRQPGTTTRARTGGSGRSAAKLFCSEMVGRAADLAVQVHGGLGYMRGVPVERMYRDARLFRIYEGTSEIQRLIIGRALVRDGV